MNHSNNIFRYLVLIAMFSLGSTSLFAQLTKVRGTVVDAETQETLPYVNIQFAGTTIGTISDLNGNFFIQARTESDTLLVSFIGYNIQKIRLQKKQYQEIKVVMAPTDNLLSEIVVKAGENPAWRILRNIIENKKKNDIEQLSSYEYEVYNKMEIDLNNVDEELRKRKVFKNFDFVFNYIDTSAETGKNYLPVFISESVSDYYYQHKPKRKKEIIKANRISGMKNEGVAQYTGQMYVDVNIYDNFIDVFSKPFVSPLNNSWKLYYKYYLLDSTYIDGNHCYLVSFKPKRKQEATFTGEFWVADTTWAIKKAKARIAEDANLNYVNDFIVQVEFEKVDSSNWFLTREELFVDFNLTDKTTGLFGRKTTTKKNVKVNHKYKKGFFSSTEPEESIVQDGAVDRDTAVWNELRHERLSQKEKAIYSMVDSIKDVKLFQTISDIMTMLTVGYYDFGLWEWGPYFTTYSSNPVEGHRFRFGGRTSSEFSEKIRLEGYGAYGTDDERFKYSAGLHYIIKDKPRRDFKVKYRHDVEQLGLSVNAFKQDNILSTILTRDPNDKLQMIDLMQAEYRHEWFQGFSNSITLSNRVIYGSEALPFQNVETEQAWNSISASEINLTTRWAFNEKFLSGTFRRVSLGSAYPILTLGLTAGMKGVLESDYEYYHVKLDIDHHFDLPPFGQFQYRLQGGKLFGDLPFPLLKLHEGNGTYAFDKYAFNMMQYYEFASDTYFSFYGEHHFNGFFLNKIPLMRKLKWREIAYAKGLIGTISDGNSKENAIMDFPTSLGDVSKPYFEVGVGIENIFKIFRLDGIWRLSYLDEGEAPRFGLRASVQIIL